MKVTHLVFVCICGGFVLIGSAHSRFLELITFVQYNEGWDDAGFGTQNRLRISFAIYSEQHKIS